MEYDTTIIPEVHNPALGCDHIDFLNKSNWMILVHIIID